MKGVLKIKKKYIKYIMSILTLLNLFINLNTVSAQEFEDNIVFEHDFNVSNREVYNYKLDEPIEFNRLEFELIGNSSTRKVQFKYLGKIIEDFWTLNTKTGSKDFEKIIIDEINILSAEGSGNVNFKFILRIIQQISNINNLDYDINNNEVVFNYELPTDNNFSHLELHQDGLLLADNITTNLFEVYNLEYDTKYNFTFYVVDKDGNKSTGISREIALPSDPNLIPSNNIFGLNHSVSDTTVSFNYSLPLDNNFSHLKIYRNNELINDNYQLAEFIDTGLEPETEYNYRFVSVNKMDISNAGYALTIKTMEENDDVPPAVPTSLEITAMNSGIVLSWNTNNESDLQGYFVYMNGVKMNSKPITNTIYNITNLENGTEYSFTVSAVDTFGNESEQSISVLGVPDVDQLPIFKLDTQLSSIGTSVENWFSEIWLIVAFATAIPLSFVIAGRIKGLFIA